MDFSKYKGEQATMIGRKAECSDLDDVMQRADAQLVAVYGRRRVGKTYLIREYFQNRFSFYHTGMHQGSMREQLQFFRDSLIEYGIKVTKSLESWREAFLYLRRLLESLSGADKKVVFLDEMPWLDTPRSNFLPAFEHFWNSWASSRKDIVVIVCGSASSWIVKKVLKNHGGLYNRVTERLLLRPFTLCECEAYAQSAGLCLTRQEVCAYYMVLGGVPFYWSLLKKGLSVPQNIDRLFFEDGGKLADEYQDLFSSLFADADGYRQIVMALGTASKGLTRGEISHNSGVGEGGTLVERLNVLELCGFIRKYSCLNKKVKDSIYQLTDNFVLFCQHFVVGTCLHDEHFWSHNYLSPKHNAWAGLAFEQVCLQHIRQIKHALQIGGVASDTYSWLHQPDEVHPHRAQIDMLIDRADGVINLCEMKYSRELFALNQRVLDELYQKRQIFTEVTKTRKAVHLTMITSEGLTPNSFARNVQSQVKLDDLFCE